MRRILSLLPGGAAALVLAASLSNCVSPQVETRLQPVLARFGISKPAAKTIEVKP